MSKVNVAYCNHMEWMNGFGRGAISLETGICKLCLKGYEEREGEIEPKDYIEQLEQKLAKAEAENKRLREPIDFFLEDYSERDMTFGWHDILANKFKEALKEGGK